MVVAYRNIFALIVIAMIIHWLPTTFKNKYRELFINSPQWAKATVVVLAVFVIWQARTAGLQPFIYFQF